MLSTPLGNPRLPSLLHSNTMRLPLHSTDSLLTAITTLNEKGGQPLAFLDSEPFLIELQGSLELPGGHGEGSEQEMRGLSIGKVDFTEPVSYYLPLSHCQRLSGSP